MEKKRKARWTKDDTHFSILALPTAVWYILFCYLPMFGIIIAFKEYRISGGFLKSIIASKWVGFQNFKFLFSNKDIWMILRNTLGYNAVMIVVGTVLTIGLAIIVSELHNKRSAKLYQTILFFPYFLSWVVVSTLVWGFLSYDMGMVNNVLDEAGLEKHRWYMEPKFWPGFLVFMSQWKGVGCGMVVYLATIAGLDKTVYEAAIIDGATKWQQITRITLPMMKTIIVLQFIMAVGKVFYSDFGLFYQVPRNSNSLYTIVSTLDVFVYNQLKSSTTGMAAAAAMFQSITACVMTLLVNWIVKKIDDDMAMI
ncbi:MAG: ABC transporter permease subunit [Spirochaetaceae bacterium]|jgi:putative aldouronate transport system permease protein|nr:ABC transporter permease subunit [Spirochaetaceae bacterium]